MDDDTDKTMKSATSGWLCIVLLAKRASHFPVLCYSKSSSITDHNTTHNNYFYVYFKYVISYLYKKISSKFSCTFS